MKDAKNLFYIVPEQIENLFYIVPEQIENLLIITLFGEAPNRE